MADGSGAGTASTEMSSNKSKQSHHHDFMVNHELISDESTC